MLNGWYVYGGRRTWDTETFPREYKKIRAMADVRDRYIWDLAQGKVADTAGRRDDRRTDRSADALRQSAAALFRADRAEISDAGRVRQERCKVPDGFEVQPFASEREFPELAKPDQMNFDNTRPPVGLRACRRIRNGSRATPRPNDRLLIFEDTDHDGRADKCTVFYDKLHCPTGFEFWNGGVLVGDQPRMLWIKDTDGDDKADLVVDLLDGAASDDTHHAMGKSEYSNGGLLAHARRHLDEHHDRNAVGPVPPQGRVRRVRLRSANAEDAAFTRRPAMATRGATSSTSGARASSATAPPRSSIGTRRFPARKSPAAAASIPSSTIRACGRASAASSCHAAISGRRAGPVHLCAASST